MAEMSSLQRLGTPSQFRRREDLYRESMDPHVMKDTSPVHWALDKEETTKFLQKLFPDARLFPSSSGTLGRTRTMKYLMKNMMKTRHRLKNRWAYFPSLTSSQGLEDGIAEFFNGVIQHVPDSHTCTRRWTGKAARNPMKGFNGAVRKPDLLLCEESIISKRVAQAEKFDAKTDIYSLGEVKQSCTDGSKSDSFVELAGKVALLLEAQDGRYAVPGIQLIGSSIILTLFDRGGSVSTHPLDIHDFPEEFLRILLGVTFGDGTTLGFDSSITPMKNNQKMIRIVKQNEEYHIFVDTLLCSSMLLHSRGTTVWTGKVTICGVEQEVVVKDSWVDPLRRYTEGRILKMLGEAGVKGVPTLIHEQQVQTSHVITGELVNHSTHVLRTILGRSPRASYYLRVLSRLVSKPRGYPIFDFNSLAELLVGLIDCLCAHCDALKRARILHRDISILNLLFVLAKHSNVDETFLDRVLNSVEKDIIRAKIRALSRRGLLADWGYAIPVEDPQTETPPQGEATTTAGVRLSGTTKLASLAELESTHNILISVADEPLPCGVTSIDANPLHRTGTWAWMAAELSHVGPGKPVIHKAHHDLESFFYILLGICLLYDEPGKLKPRKVLAQSFDPFFIITKPSTFKVITVQSDFGWTTLMLPWVSPYFQPLIPLLEEIRREFILHVKTQDGKVQTNPDFTHDHFIDRTVTALAKLPEGCWAPIIPSTRKGKSAVYSGRISSSASLSFISSTADSVNAVLPQAPLPRPVMGEVSKEQPAGGSKLRTESEGELVFPNRWSSVGSGSNPSTLDVSPTATSPGTTSWADSIDSDICSLQSQT